MALPPALCPDSATLLRTQSKYAPAQSDNRDDAPAGRGGSEPVCDLRSYGWGDPVKWGTSNLVDSAEACCEQCLHFKPKSASDQTCNGEYAWLRAFQQQTTLSRALAIFNCELNVLTCRVVLQCGCGAARKPDAEHSTESAG